MKKVCMMVTNPCTNDARVLKEASTLSSNGYLVIILAPLGINTPKEEHINGANIKRVKKSFKSNSLLGKLEFSLKFILYSVREKADIYHAHDLSTLLECYIASRINKAKIIYDSHELYINNYGKLSFGDLLYYLLEKSLINKVDCVITVNSLIGDKLQSRYNLKKAPLIIMNAPSKKASEICESSKIEDKFLNMKRSNKKIILYQGTMQEGRGLKQLIESIKYLDDKYYLLMVGDGPLKADLEALVQRYNLYNVYFTGMVDYRVLPKYTQIADLGVILFENNSLNNYYASPNKLFEYIHSEVPVLAPDYPFIKHITQKYNVGILLEDIDPKQISDKIETIFDNLEEYNRLKEGTKVAKMKLNWEIEEINLVKMYQELNI